MKKSLESELGFFPADAKAPVILQPCDCALDRPSPFVTTQGAAVLRDEAVGTVGSDYFHSLQGEFFIQSVAVVGLVADDSLGQLGTEHEAEEFLDQAAFMRVGRSGADRQRQPLGIDQNHDFHSFAGLGAADACAPALCFGEGSIHKAFVEAEAALFFDHAPHGAHGVVEDPGFHPAQKPPVHAALGAEASGQVFPLRPVVQDPEDSGQGTPLVDGRAATFGADFVIRNQHFKDIKLSFAEYKHEHNNSALSMPTMGFWDRF